MRRRHDVHCGRIVGRMVKDMVEVVLCISPACAKCSSRNVVRISVRSCLGGTIFWAVFPTLDTY